MNDGLRVFLQDEVQELIDALAHTFQVRIALFSTEMEELRVGLHNPGSPFCRLVQGPLMQLSRCRQMDRRMCQRAELLNQTTHYRCHAGLLEAVLPIRGGSGTIGYLMVGQFRDTDVPSEEILTLVTSETGHADFIHAFLEIPKIDATSREKMLTLASMLVQFLVSQELLGLRPSGLMDPLAAWVGHNLNESPRIAEAAQALGKGVSTVAHAVKHATGHGFTRYVQTRKVERFEALMRSRPGLQIRQAALQAGFSDPLYFSRVYRKIRGVSPRQALVLFREEASSTRVP